MKPLGKFISLLTIAAVNVFLLATPALAQTSTPDITSPPVSTYNPSNPTGSQSGTTSPGNAATSSPNSESATTTPHSSPADTTMPSVPANLSATSTSPSQVTISWAASTDPDNNASQLSYAIYRDGTQIANTTEGATTYTDSGLDPGTQYMYLVSASDPAGNTSGLSSAAMATTLAASQTPSMGPPETNPGTSTPPFGNGTSTPPTFTAPNNSTIVGWLLIPQSMAGQMPSMGTGSPFSYYTTDSNGYPMLGNNYVDCNGNIDNDMTHHSIDPGDTDPGHHIGLSCPNGAPTAPSFTNNTLNIPDLPGGPWVMIPITQDELNGFMGSGPGTSPAGM